MTDETTDQRKARLLDEARKQGREAIRLNSRQFAVRSLRFPDESHVVTIDPLSGYAVDCSPVAEEDCCYGFQRSGFCSHSLVTQAIYHELQASDSLLHKLEQSVAIARIHPPDDFDPEHYTDPVRGAEIEREMADVSTNLDELAVRWASASRAWPTPENKQRILAIRVEKDWLAKRWHQLNQERIDLHSPKKKAEIDRRIDKLFVPRFGRGELKEKTRCQSA